MRRSVCIFMRPVSVAQWLPNLVVLFMETDPPETPFQADSNELLRVSNSVDTHRDIAGL